MKKRILIGFFLGFVLIAGWFGYWEFSTAKLIISSQEGVEIYVAASSEEPFVKIGTETANYSLHTEQFVFVRAINGAQVTERSIFMERGQTQEINLSLSETVTPSDIAPGPLTHPYQEGSIVYGISPYSQSMTYYSRDNLSDNNFVSLHDVRDIGWVDSDNYTFNSLRYGVGGVVDGVVYYAFLGEDTTDYFFHDFSQYKPGGLIYLLSTDSIYTATNPKKGDVELFADVERHDVSSISSDGNYVYVSGVDYYQDGEHVGGPENSTIHVFDLSGKEITTFSLGPVENIYGVTYSDKTSSFVVLEDKGLSFVDKASGGVTTTPRHSNNTQDMLVFNNNLIILGDDGLWRYDFDSESYQLISPFVGDSEYVPSSLMLQGSSVLYSTQPSENTNYDELDSSSYLGSSVYKIGL